jgi:hypothetical protein
MKNQSSPNDKRRLPKRSKEFVLMALFTLLVSIFGFILLFFFFNHLRGSRFGDDLAAHFTIGLGESRVWSNDPPHWLFFSIIRTIYQQSGSQILAYNCFLGILSLSALFKYWIFVFQGLVIGKTNLASWMDIKRHGLGLAIIFCAVIPVISGINEAMYLGYINSSDWRSSTSIVSVPFAALLFFLSVRALTQRRLSWALVGLIALVEFLLVQAKPNYMLAFLPGFTLVWVYYFWIEKKDVHLIKRGAVIATAGFLSLFERWLSHYVVDGGGLQFFPFAVWLNFVGNSYWKLWLALLSSIALPLVYFLESRIKELAVGKEFNLAAAILAVAVIQYILVAELTWTFARDLIWQSMIASSIMHMVVAQQAYQKNNRFTLAFLFLEFLVGINVIRVLLS